MFLVLYQEVESFCLFSQVDSMQFLSLLIVCFKRLKIKKCLHKRILKSLCFYNVDGSNLHGDTFKLRDTSVQRLVYLKVNHVC